MGLNYDLESQLRQWQKRNAIGRRIVGICQGLIGAALLLAMLYIVERYL